MLVKKLSLYLALVALSQVAISRAAFAETTVINTGEITRSGYRAYGVSFIGSSNIITNSGSITTSGQESFGVLGYGNSNIITNSGSIITSGVGAYGVYVNGNSNTITNSGSIISKYGYAIYFSGIGNTLNILNNFMGGGINLGTSGVARVTTGPNYSKLYSFEGANLTISGSGPVPLFVNAITNKVATFDPTIFAGSADALADMAYTVSSLADGRLGENII